MLRRGEWMHPDFNLYDSQHELTHHPYLKDGSWKNPTLEAWRTFYSLENMKAILQRTPRANYWNNFLRFIWYKNSIQTEGRHPMMCGYLRLKGRTARRPGFPVLSRWDYYTARLKDSAQRSHGMLNVLAEMEELWLQTRHRSEAERRVTEEIAKLRAKYGQLKITDFQAAFQRAKDTSPRSTYPPRSLSSGPSGVPCWFPHRSILAPISTPFGTPSASAGRNATSSVSPSSWCP